ncbi:MAG: ATP-binding cassette domain-containing protein [Pseudomonadota bacterium]
MAPLITLQGARLAYGPRVILEDTDLQIDTADRICLVGRNGAGKSTLLRILAGEIELDAGAVRRQPATTAAYLPQDPPPPASGTLRDYVGGGINDPVGIEKRMFQADRVLEDLSLGPDRHASNLSGGEARRLAIARALVSAPDLLLLDEPTNHLDLNTIEYLEIVLKAYRGAIAVISHDRAFLRAVSTKTWWLDRGTVHASSRGFASFEEWSEELLATEEAEWNRKAQYLKAEEHWLHRGVTARRKRNQGRLRKLEDLRRERRDRVRLQGNVKLDVAQSGRSGTLVIEAEDISKSFGRTPICRNFSTRIMRGDKIGVIGPNGAGKTTLLKMLLGEMAPDEGHVRLGTNLEIARFEQQREGLDLNRTPWENLCPDGGDKVRVGTAYKHVVGYLRDFLFDEAQARMKVGALSGGERNRLLLAKILAEPTNFLVLDEPTNDLDMDTLDLLQELLADYRGTLLLVSHDRDFLDRIATSTIVFEGLGLVAEYPGGYSDYLFQRPALPAARSEPTVTSRPAAEPRGSTNNRRRLMENKLSRELTRLPDRIAAQESKIRDAETMLADPALYAKDPQRFATYSAQLEVLQEELMIMEERWLELEAMREEIEAS